MSVKYFPYYLLVYGEIQKFTTPLTKLMTSELRIAPVKSMVTFGVSQIVKPTIAMLMISVKSPIVKTISGRAIRVIRGLISEFATEKMKPARTKIQKLLPP